MEANDSLSKGRHLIEQRGASMRGLCTRNGIRSLRPIRHERRSMATPPRHQVASSCPTPLAPLVTCPNRESGGLGLGSLA